MKYIEENIKKIISKSSGRVGVKILFSDGNELSINEKEVFPSASLIKLFILLAIEKTEYNKFIEITENIKVGSCGVLKILKSPLKLSIRDLIGLMICFSDNTATNILIDYLGMEEINKKIKKVGFEKTILARKMMDNDAKKEGKENYTTPEEVQKVISILCKDEEIKYFLLNQGYNNKISLYFARENNIKFAHKTGELTCVEHDAGRIFYKDYWVDVVVMTKNLKNNGEGVEINNQIGKILFSNLIK